jgi:hypothetical protein
LPAILQTDPGLVGNLDGIPVAVRDQANRTQLADAITRYEGRRHNLQTTLEAMSGYRNSPGRSLTYDPVKDDLDATTERLNGLRAIQDRLDRPVTPGIPTRLPDRPAPGRGQGPRHRRRGNPDTADNVLTYVPGTGAKIGNIGGAIDRSDAMEESARLADSSAQTAAVTWVGYAAPQRIPEAAGYGSADHAGPGLRQFQDGLRATHEGPPSRNTVLGHSYGTTVVGHAARDGDLAAARTVLVASPGPGTSTGTGTDDVTGLHRPPRHRLRHHLGGRPHRLHRRHRTQRRPRRPRRDLD